MDISFVNIQVEIKHLNVSISDHQLFPIFIFRYALNFNFLFPLFFINLKIPLVFRLTIKNFHLIFPNKDHFPYSVRYYNNISEDIKND
jgi:hypothetical protein